MASSSCFTAYLLDETASTASSNPDNVDQVDLECLPSGMSSFLGHLHVYGSASLKQNMDLAYYCSNQLVEIAIQGYKVDKGQVSDLCHHTSRPACSSRVVLLLKRCQYLSTVLSQFDRDKLEKILFTVCVGVEDMHTIWTMSL